MAARARCEIGDEHAAVVALTGDAEPELLADLPGDRVGKARMLELARRGDDRQINEQLNNWTVVGVPNEGWATQVFGEPDVERLWKLVEFCVRLDEDDPVAAWRQHVDPARPRAPRARRAAASTACTSRGPGTDLTVGLLPESRWQGCESLTARRHQLRRQHADRGGVHHARPAGAPRASCARRGRWRSTGRSSKASRCASRAGGIVEVHADEGDDVVRGQLETDDQRTVPRRGRARRRDVAHRQDRRHVLRHALRRERNLPRRVRQRATPRRSTAA